MKVREIVKLIEWDGWYQVRQRGSHRQFNHPNKPGKVTIPGHANDDLGPELKASIPETGEFEAMTKSERYLILVEGGPPSNYGAWSPDILGCVATGDTIASCVREMRSALAFHLEGMREDGEAIPDPSGPGVYVKHEAAA